MYTRRKLYKRGKLPSTRFDVPIISIGNLTMGGSGKTPLVIYLARLFSGDDHRIGVISRGYKGNSNKRVNIVSTGEDILLDSSDAGDEPFQIAESVPSAVVLTGKKRAHPIQYAIEKCRCNLILLDDGFQHLSVERSVDLVLFNGANLELLHVFPSGMLRESFTALHDCDAIVITNSNLGDIKVINSFKAFIKKKFPEKHIFSLSFLPYELKGADGNTYPLSILGDRVFAFCGIAHPQRFSHTLSLLDTSIAGFYSFKDHHNYQEKDVSKMEEMAIRSGAEAIVTTDKDMVKLSEWQCPLPLYSLKMDIPANSSFDDFIIEKVAGFQTDQN